VSAPAAAPAGRAAPAASPLARLRAAAWEQRLPLAVALGASAVLAAFSGRRFLHQSKAPHFVYQAAAFLEGRLDLAVDPPNQEDWVKVGDRFYVSFPAVPAVVMLPFVALFGYQLNDTSFTVFVAGLSLMLFFLVLRRLSRAQDSPRGEREDLAFTAILGFGTLFFCCAIRGEVWFTAQVMGVGFTSLYLLAAHRAARPLLAGLAWSAAALSRTPLAFAGAFFAAEALWPSGSLSWEEARRDPGQKLRKLARFAAGGAPLFLLHAAFNLARFGGPGEFGHRLLWNNRVNADIARWGLFSYQYLERNLHAAFTRLPNLSLHPFAVGYDPHGMSMLVTTPLLVLLLWPRQKPRLHRALWLTVACTALPGLFYQNDGYMQFGFRFSLDYTPFLVILLALGGWSMRGKAFAALAAAGLAVNLWGALAFRGYSW
jgi:hypothetical protein